MHGGGGSGLGGWSGGGVDPKNLFPAGSSPDGPRRGRWFGDQGAFRGRRGTAMLLGLMVLVALLLVLSFTL